MPSRQAGGRRDDQHGLTTSGAACQPRPPLEIRQAQVRALLAAPPRAPAPYQTTQTIYASAWVAARPTFTGFSIIDVARDCAEARAIARRHPGAVVAFEVLAAQPRRVEG